MPRETRPHVFLLMADQLRWDCLSCYGGIPVRTPNLDALAGESVVFQNAYCATPLCGPTRTTMYTGKWAHTHGALVNGGPHDALMQGQGQAHEREYARAGAQHRSLYEALDQGGYRITHVGVHHCRLEPPVEERVPNACFEHHQRWKGYAAAHAIEASAYNYKHVKKYSVPTIDYANGRPIVKMIPNARAHMRFPAAAEHFLDFFWARRAVEMIERMDFSSPQYLETLFWAPHPPHVVPEPYYSMYPPAGIPLPQTVGRWCAGQPATLLLQATGAYGATCVLEDYREAWGAYLGLVTLVDECIGMVIRALKERGVWDDALVLFATDHGEMLGCHHLWEKMAPYEEASHVALFARPPGGGRPGARSQLVSHVDFADTICDYAGLPRLGGSQGDSWRRLVEDGDGPWRENAFMEYHGDWGRGGAWRAVVSALDGRRYKYVYTPGDVDELYDLTEDREEQRSLAGDPEHRAVRNELESRLARWMKQTGDHLPPGLVKR